VWLFVGTTTAHTGEGLPHLPNWAGVLAKAVGAGTSWGRWLHTYEDLVFAAMIAMGLCGLFGLASRRIREVPHGFQNLLEMAVERIHQFVIGIMGPEGHRYAPFVGSLFLYIWAMNLAGLLLPGFKSPTASLNTTLGLALCVFLYVQYTGLRSFGVKGYLHHLMGSPEGLAMAFIGLLILLIELIGELVKPLSLAMRLAFNITGEDTFLSVAVRFGPMGILLQLLAMGLGLILGTAQALVFATLSAVFLGMKLSHGETHRHEGH